MNIDELARELESLFRKDVINGEWSITRSTTEVSDWWEVQISNYEEGGKGRGRTLQEALEKARRTDG